MIIILLILVILLIIIFFIFRKTKREKLSDKYDIYKKIFKQNIKTKQLILANPSYFIENDLDDKQIDDIVYYLLISNEDDDRSIAYVTLNHLPFIQMPDVIESDNKISNYYGYMKALHIITGKNEDDIIKMRKKDLIHHIEKIDK
jgi:hypothetical protein